MAVNDGYIYGLDEFYFDGHKLGYINEDGVQSGGDAPTTVQVRAAQAKNAVVKTIMTSPGVDRFTIIVIELKPENIVPIFGGTVTAGVYTAPRVKETREGRAFIKCFSGHKIDIPKAMLTSNLTSGINLASVLSITCNIEVAIPDDENIGPFVIHPPGAIVPDDPSEPTG